MTDDEEFGYGDRAGEYLRMARGQYHAGLHLVIGFILVVAAFWVPLNYGTVAIFDSRFPSLMADRFDRTQHLQEIATGAAIAAFLLALLVFKDRWRCIEATASNYCSGVANFSILYVPIIVAGYALARGVLKLRGR